MTEPIFDPKFWGVRLHTATAPHQRICICSEEYWAKVEQRHEAILWNEIKSDDYILDAGCAFGRLLDLLPGNWQGKYLGIDLSEDYIALAKSTYQESERIKFLVGDLRNLHQYDNKLFDVGIMISIKQMVVDNAGIEVWDQIHAELKRVCKRLLILEYGE